MIGSVWLISAFLAFLPIFTNLYTTDEYAEDVDKLNYMNGICEFKVNFKYRIASSIIMFWFPTAGIAVFYCLLMYKARNVLNKETYKASQLTLRSRVPQEFYNEEQLSGKIRAKAMVELDSLAKRRHSSVGVLVRYENWRREYRLVCKNNKNKKLEFSIKLKM